MSAIYENNPTFRTTSGGEFACPLCGRTVEGNSGFRKAGMKRHVFACWEKSLAARGLRLGAWSERKNGYRLIRVEQEEKR